MIKNISKVLGFIMAITLFFNSFVEVAIASTLEESEQQESVQFEAVDEGIEGEPVEDEPVEDDFDDFEDESVEDDFDGFEDEESEEANRAFTPGPTDVCVSLWKIDYDGHSGYMDVYVTGYNLSEDVRPIVYTADGNHTPVAHYVEGTKCYFSTIDQTVYNHDMAAVYRLKIDDGVIVHNREYVYVDFPEDVIYLAAVGYEDKPRVVREAHLEYITYIALYAIEGVRGEPQKYYTETGNYLERPYKYVRFYISDGYAQEGDTITVGLFRYGNLKYVHMDGEPAQKPDYCTVKKDEHNRLYFEIVPPSDNLNVQILDGRSSDKLYYFNQGDVDLEKVNMLSLDIETVYELTIDTTGDWTLKKHLEPDEVVASGTGPYTIPLTSTDPSQVSIASLAEYDGAYVLETTENSRAVRKGYKFKIDPIHTITYDLQAEDVSWIKAGETSFMESKGLSADALGSVTKDGYYFCGWYDAAEDGNQVTGIDADTDHDVILYARWQEAEKLSPVTASLDSGATVKMGSLLELKGENNATIYYVNDKDANFVVDGTRVTATKVVDGIQESVAVNEYRNEIVIDDTTYAGKYYVKAIAVKYGYIQSDPVTFEYDVAEDDYYGDIPAEYRDEYLKNEAWVHGIPSSVTYMGKAVVFDPKTYAVFFDNTLLKYNKDYTATYKTNINVGTDTALMTIKGKGNYAFTLTKKFSILQKNLEDGAYVKTNSIVKMANGKEQKVKNTVICFFDATGKSITLTENKDYTLAFSDSQPNAYKTPGKYVVNVTGKGNYTGSLSYEVIISEISISVGKASIDAADYKVAEPTIKVTQKIAGKNTVLTGYKLDSAASDQDALSKYLAVKDTVGECEYVYYFVNNTEVTGGFNTAKPEVRIIPTNQEVGANTYAVVKNFTIAGSSITSMKLAGFKSSVSAYENVYEQQVGSSDDASKITLYNKSMKTYLKGISLAEYEVSSSRSEYDFVYKFSNAAAQGKATFEAWGINAYKGKIKKTYTIKGKAITDTRNGMTIEWDTALAKTGIPYDGLEKKADAISLTIKDNSIALVENTDYTLTYAKNKNAGVASITIKGINKYAGTKKITFKISKVEIKDENVVLDKTTYNYAKGGVKPRLIFNNLPDASDMELKTDYKVAYSNNTKVCDKAKVTITGAGNYSGKVVKAFSITKQDFTDDTVLAKAADVVYQNKPGTCKPVITVIDKVSAVKLAAGTDYEKTVKYQYKYATTVNVKVGTGFVEEVRNAGDEVKSTDIISAGTVIDAKLTGKNNYNNQSIVVPFKYSQASIASAQVKVKKKPYKGKSVIITKADIESIKIKVGITTYDLSPEYYIIDQSTYKNNNKIGKASVVIKGVGQYTGEKTITFDIVAYTAPVPAPEPSPTPVNPSTCKHEWEMHSYGYTRCTYGNFFVYQFWAPDYLQFYDYDTGRFYDEVNHEGGWSKELNYGITHIEVESYMYECTKCGKMKEVEVGKEP